ncbi:teichoic acid ABC transporter permease [Paenibacillus polymyxa]|nr:teichoic acid ABC transporter permease [Paenibacillus polymyxa]
MRSTISFYYGLFKSRRIILELARSDFKDKYLGSYLGTFWAFFQPMLLILIYWFVFQVGLRNEPIDNYPFILWLLAGLIPWFFFSDSISSATYAVVQNTFLVKKIVFKVNNLPIIKIVSSGIINFLFIGIMLLIFLCYGELNSIYNFFVVYYLFCLVSLVVGLSWFTSSLLPFFKDIGQIVNSILQIGFWVTPIFWSFSILPAKYEFIFKLNPMFYIVQGFRDSLIYHKGFWEHPWLLLYFWSVTLALLIGGAFLYKKLVPHFPDVL